MLVSLWLCVVATAQHPAPNGSVALVGDLVEQGESALRREDPMAAWLAFRAVCAESDETPDGLVGLGRAHLLLGRSGIALAYADAALGASAWRQDAMTLSVRARVHAREFEEAVRSATDYVARCEAPTAELLAAKASALFRVRRTDDAAVEYQQVLLLDALHAEAHLRLGSGLSSPRVVTIGDAVKHAVATMVAGDLVLAIDQLQELLAADPGNPVLHRLLGEALFQQRANASMAGDDPVFARLRQQRPVLPIDKSLLAEFIPAYPDLSPERKAAVEWAVGLFAGRLDKLLALGGRHDLLLEIDRTTDAESRALLRGKRTFDGRVWDDVRGIGGLRAATGIESLDEAHAFGFDTLVHEIAHQVHYYAIPHRQRVEIRRLYNDALAEGRCLDYYAASNEAEYFGQGVEAFASLGKRPGGETTHGHTRFELLRKDPALHDLVAKIVDRDPLTGPGSQDLLLAAFDVALRVGRPKDALVAAGMLTDKALREGREAVARTALFEARSH